MEESADSEADFVQSEFTAICGGGDDDAESCSCDTGEVSGSQEDDCDGQDSGDQWNNLSQGSSIVWASDQEDGHVSMGVDEEEESWVNSGGGSGGRGLSKEEMDAMEDKDFWETCMAIGYP
ncbi:hypothetical protein ACJRO7_032234 [Eucalyptus globulus]|uniref:Uncharacterized protein n=1 Tax=Eucalyptus globulus TaxID=34317 RepID=A0ABD3JK58_EUCGL